MRTAADFGEPAPDHELLASPLVGLLTLGACIEVSRKEHEGEEAAQQVLKETEDLTVRRVLAVAAQSELDQARQLAAELVPR